MSTTGDPDVGQPDARRPSPRSSRPAPTEREAYLEQALVNGRVLAGDEHIDEDWIVERNGLAFDRGLNPDGSAAQLLALAGLAVPVGRPARPRRAGPRDPR